MWPTVERRNDMIRNFAIALPCLLVAATAGAAVNLSQATLEESEARQEEARILQRPIAGIENKFWFNYRADVNEARKELASDLARASDMEDLRDGWEEYRGELVDSRTDYAKQMAKRGYRQAIIEVTE
jgi:hypothetical protein